jgi:hypothetical protein
MKKKLKDYGTKTKKFGTKCNKKTCYDCKLYPYDCPYKEVIYNEIEDLLSNNYDIGTN